MTEEAVSITLTPARTPLGWGGQRVGGLQERTAWPGTNI